MKEHDPVNAPSHYTAAGEVYQPLNIIEAWGLDFLEGNVLKYLLRAGKKDPSKRTEDLKKAQFYMNRLVEREEQRQ